MAQNTLSKDLCTLLVQELRHQATVEWYKNIDPTKQSVTVVKSNMGKSSVRLLFNLNSCDSLLPLVGLFCN